MSYGIFTRILEALSRLGMTPEQLVTHLEFLASMNSRETER